MLTMLIGGPADGQFIEIRGYPPVFNVPEYNPVDLSISPASDDVWMPARMKVHTYEHRAIGFHQPTDWIVASDFDYRVDVFVHPDVDIRRFGDRELVAITMKLYRESWRRKILAQTPEHVKEVWRKQGVDC